MLFIPFPSVFWNWSRWECRGVYYAMRKSKRFLQDLLAVLKPTPLLPHAQMLLVPILFFFFWRVDYALKGSMFWLSKCDFSRLFHTERSWHAYWFSVVFEFLVFMVCSLMQERFLWPLCSLWLAPSPPLFGKFQHGAFASKLRAQRKRLHCRLSRLFHLV